MGDVSRRVGRKHAQVLADEVDQKAPLDYGPVTLDFDSTLLEDPWFKSWAAEFVASLGTFLDSRDSFDAGLLRQFRDRRPDFHVIESLVDGAPNEPSGWLTFNQFAARRVARTAVGGADSPIAPADADVAAVHALRGTRLDPPLTTRDADYDDLAALLGESAARYADGAVVRFHVAPTASHRFYAPVNGRVVRRHTEIRENTKTVVIDADGRFDLAPGDDGLPFYSSLGLVELEANVGRVALVALSPTPQAVSILPRHAAKLTKHDDLGFFPYAGEPCDILVVFQARAARPLLRDARALVGTPLRAGDSINGDFLAESLDRPGLPSLSFVLQFGLPFLLLSFFAAAALFDLATDEFGHIVSQARM